MEKGQKKIRKLLSSKHVILILCIVIIVIIATLGINDHFSSTGKTTHLGFENVGKLVTQSATCTELRCNTKDRKLFGASIPFTTSRFIYSYDVTVNAGYDFDKIDITPPKEKLKSGKGTIYVKLPQPEIISCNIDEDSFQVYDEENNIFSPITMEEQNDSRKEMKESAKQDAIDNGLYVNAESNVKTLIKSFLYQTYDSEKYDIVFK